MLFLILIVLHDPFDGDVYLEDCVFNQGIQRIYCSFENNKYAKKGLYAMIPVTKVDNSVVVLYFQNVILKEKIVKEIIELQPLIYGKLLKQVIHSKKKIEKLE